MSKIQKIQDEGAASSLKQEVVKLEVVSNEEPAVDQQSQKKSLIGLSFEEVAEIVKDLGEQAFRAKQLWNWIYVQGVSSFDEMTNMSKELRKRLDADYEIYRTDVSKDYISIDGTRKWLIKLRDGHEVEVVYIPEEDRGTLCVSSQVGCTLTCSFCHTGTQRLVRNLTAEEIVAQVMLAKDSLDDWPSTKPERLVSNIVMMGMGEPLLNYDEVAKGLKIIMDGSAISISRRRVTLSTSGIVPLIKQCGDDLGVNLAISLHAVRDELRNELVPINRKHPIKELLEACHNYPAASNTKRITFEYTMIDGKNDSDEDARALVKLIEGIPAKVNLIPFNPWPGTDYKCSPKERIASFAKIVNDAGYASPVRKPRGQDIYAACGQLKSESVRKRVSSA